MIEDIMLKEALWYRSKSLPVMPINPKTKLPLEQWKAYQVELPSRLQIKKWWQKWPRANIALLCGEHANVTVVDCDSKDAIQRVENLLPDSLLMPIQQSGGGGRHYFFAYTPGLKNWNRILPKIDVKTQGGYVLLSPSVSSKGQYKWFDRLHIGEQWRPKMPNALKNALIEAAKKENVHSQSKTS